MVESQYILLIICTVDYMYLLIRSAVGVCVALMSHDQMLANQMRGKGFRVLHMYGDYLWYVWNGLAFNWGI